MKRFVSLLLTLIVVCSQFSAAAPVMAENPSANPLLQPDKTYATLGEVLAVHGHTLSIKQEALEFKPGKDVKVRHVEHKLSIGYPGNHLQVITDGETAIFVDGEQIALSDNLIGMKVVVSGRLTGNSLKATRVIDLSTLASPPENYEPYAEDPYSEPILPGITSPAASDTLSLCMGQDLDYDADPTIKDFQGCWGGPSASDDINIPDVPFSCPLVGCFVIDRFAYVAALGGWGFAFPFQFSATASDLTYHIPGPVTLNVQPLPATPNDSTFWGGLGIDFGINVDFCSIGGCSDLGTVWLGLIPSMLHQSDGAAPLPGQTLDIEEVTCPSLGGIEIPDTPISLISVDLCEDLGLSGQPFNARVEAIGSSLLSSQYMEFTGPDQEIIIRPDSLNIETKFDNFWYVPDINMGIYFDLNALHGTLDIYQTPTISLASGPFPAITTPFPYTNSLMTVATDPLSPIDDLRYLYQPTEVNFSLEVQPAPTRLTIISPAAVAEGEPIEALLQEDYDGTPIANETVTFTSGNISISAITNELGIAQVVLPNGEHYLTVNYAGSPYYLPSTDSMGPIYVYKPTNFVIWGGKSGNVKMGQAYQFWGSQWWKQVTGTSFRGVASFKGYASTVSGDKWYSPPANAGNPPKSLPNFIGVIVTTNMSMKGRNLEGNVYTLVVLKVKNPATYKPNPGYQAWGNVTALIP